jgi:protein TonB
VAKEIKYPLNSLRRHVQGNVIVQFIVDTDGSLTQIEVVKGIDKECDEEALRAVASAPRCRPALTRGRPVRKRMTLPVIFKLH